MKKILFGIMCILALSSCTRSFHKWNAERVGDINQEYMIQDARNRILSYDWYYDQYNQIQAQIANIESLPRDNENKLGMIMIVNSMIGEYNSKSRQYNHNMWKANDLPYELQLYKGE